MDRFYHNRLVLRKEEKKEDADSLDWLKNAAKATEGNIICRYELTKVKGGTKTLCKVRGVGIRTQVEADAPQGLAQNQYTGI
jgi:hypothetical protein